tara:strand:+ start:399 stop:1178 length:780 start_codon:yes stop_codon:yes gene_type:complete
VNLIIYTVITGSYDTIRQPAVIDDRFTYVCFSNDFSEKKIGIWEIRKIIPVIEDKQRLSRYPKLKPHELLQEFDYSVYMDANLVITKAGFYECIFQLINQKQILSGIKNGWRDCIYEEGFRCILSRLDTAEKIIREMRMLKSEGFPEKFGMYEANIIFRKHHNEKVIKQSNMWWDTVQEFAKRDQLCFSYTMWKNDLAWSYIFPDGSNTHNNTNIIFHPHPHKKKIINKFSIRKILKFTTPFFFFLYRFLITFNLKKNV